MTAQNNLISLLVGHTIMLSWEIPSKNIFCLFYFDNGYSHGVKAPADFLISMLKVKILQAVQMDPISPNLPIPSKTNVIKRADIHFI